MLASEDARTEFDGQRLLSNAEAAAPGARAAAVIVGDLPDELNYPNLNVAFRLVRGGARLIGMHRNAWWLTPDGPTLDSGAYVTGLEFAADVRAQIIGKPAPPSSRWPSTRSGARLGRGERLRRSQIAMVGDDVRTDVLAGQRAGLCGVLVLTGKHGLDSLSGAHSHGRGGREPQPWRRRWPTSSPR